MPIVPSGSPAWTRTVDFSHFGGSVSKTNYLSRGAIDATTDLDAAQFCRLTADLAAVTRTSPFAIIRLVCNDSPALPPTIEFAHMATGVRLTSYTGNAAPTGFPSAVRNGNGDVTVSFAASYADAYGVNGVLSLRHVLPTVISTAVARAVASLPTVNTVNLKAFDAADAALSNARFDFMVW